MKITINKYYTIIAFFAILLIQYKVFAQENSSEFLKNNVSSNIISYNIKQGLKQGDVLNEFILTKPLPRFFNDIPNSKGELLLKMTKIENKEEYDYPKSNYNLYSFFHDNYEIQYPKYTTSKIIFDYYIEGSEKYLLAFNKTNNDIKFISGHYFLSLIANDFSLNKRKPISYISFIKLKTYNLKTKKIKFLKRNLKYLIFISYSEEYKKEILIYLKKNNPDIIKVKPIN